MIKKLRIPVGLLAALCAFAAWADEACTCKDIPQILLRIQEAATAVQVFSDEIAGLEGAAPTGPPIPYSKSGYESVRDAAKRALGAVRDASDVKDEGFDDSHTNDLCMTTVNATNACMAKSLAAHEGIHKAACSKTVGLNQVIKSLTFQNRFVSNGASMIDYCAEEIEGYMEEIVFLGAEIERLEHSPDPACQPRMGDWEPRAYTSDEGVML